MQSYYPSWLHLYSSYINGYKEWRLGDGNEEDEEALEDVGGRKEIVYRLLSMPDGPCSIPWDMELPIEFVDEDEEYEEKSFLTASFKPVLHLSGAAHFRTAPYCDIISLFLGRFILLRDTPDIFHQLSHLKRQFQGYLLRCERRSHIPPGFPQFPSHDTVPATAI